MCIINKVIFMKKILSAAIILLSLFLLSSCSGPSAVILDNSENSRFIDFYTEENYVYIECELNIYAEKDTKVRITAKDDDDVKTGLLSSPVLVGINKDNNSESFSLKAGENKVSVLFKGEYNGVFQISQREIPRFIIIEKD